MKRLILALVLGIFILSPAFAKKNFVSYTEAFDVFEIVDHLSGWHPNSRNEYFKYFESTYKINHADKMMLENYREVRKKYHKEYPSAQDSIFSEEAIANDILSSAFVGQSTVDKAILGLRKKGRVKDADLKQLVKVYKHFKPQVSKIVRESRLLIDESKRLNKILKKKKVLSNIKKLDRFFDLPTHRIKNGRIKLVWWPADSEPLVDFRGGRVILRMNPVKHAKLIDEEFITFALVDSLIVSLSKNKKENLSKVFKEGCPKIKEKKLEVTDWFETPLIDSLSRYYLPHLLSKKKFNPYQVKGQSAWRDVFSKYLYGLSQYSIARKAKFDREFVTISSNYCSQLLSL
jgi:hypothetical protein